MKYQLVCSFQVEALNDVMSPLELVLALVEALNHDLAKNAWKTYRTAGNNVKKIWPNLGITISFPISLEDTMIYVCYLLLVQKVQGVTLDKYLSGLHMVHILQGHVHFPPWIRVDVVKLAITGNMNKDNDRHQSSGKSKN